MKSKTSKLAEGVKRPKGLRDSSDWGKRNAKHLFKEGLSKQASNWDYSCVNTVDS